MTVVGEEAWSSLDVFCEMIHNKVNKYDTVYPPGLAAPELSAIENASLHFFCDPYSLEYEEGRETFSDGIDSRDQGGGWGFACGDAEHLVLQASVYLGWVVIKRHTSLV